MLKEIVCPLSTEEVDERASRVTAAWTAALLVVYGLSGSWVLLAIVSFDFAVRVGTRRRAPLSWLACGVTRAFGLAQRPVNKGPKMFAWRIGLAMCLFAFVLLPLAPTASVGIAWALAGFALVDGVFNVCVGCVLYTYVISPRFEP